MANAADVDIDCELEPLETVHRAGARPVAVGVGANVASIGGHVQVRR